MTACVSMEVEVPAGPRPSIMNPAGVAPINFQAETLPQVPRPNLPSPSAMDAAKALTAWSVAVEGAGQPPADDEFDEDEEPLPAMAQPVLSTHAPPSGHGTRSGGALYEPPPSGHGTRSGGALYEAPQPPMWTAESAGHSPSLRSDLAKVLSEAQPVAQFVRTLHRLIEGPFAQTLCQWSESGRRIVFPDPELFAETVCPQFFRHSKWTSFSRMLNMYEFRKVSSSQRNAQNQSLAMDDTRRRRPLPVVFEHEHFNQQDPQLHLVLRRKRKKTQREETKKLAKAEAAYQTLRAPVTQLEERLHGLEAENGELARRNKELEGRLRELELENAFLRSRDLDLGLP